MPHVTSALSAPLRAARDALRAERYADAIAKLNEAEANPEKTPYDEHIINVLAGAAYARTNNYADAVKAFEAQVNDGFTNAADFPRGQYDTVGSFLGKRIGSLRCRDGRCRRLTFNSS